MFFQSSPRQWPGKWDYACLMTLCNWKMIVKCSRHFWRDRYLRNRWRRPSRLWYPKFCWEIWKHCYGTLLRIWLALDFRTSIAEYAQERRVELAYIYDWARQPQITTCTFHCVERVILLLVNDVETDVLLWLCELWKTGKFSMCGWREGGAAEISRDSVTNDFCSWLCQYTSCLNVPHYPSFHAISESEKKFSKFLPCKCTLVLRSVFFAMLSPSLICWLTNDKGPVWPVQRSPCRPCYPHSFGFLESVKHGGCEICLSYCRPYRCFYDHTSCRLSCCWIPRLLVLWKTLF